MGNNSFLQNASLYFDKLMKQKYICKSDVLSLKQKLKVLKESNLDDDTYNNILNRVTRISDKATRRDSPDILREVYADFNLLIHTQLTELGTKKSNRKASPGHYRACLTLDSILYQIGKDVLDRMIAFRYCEEYKSEIQEVQIFDDNGEPHIIEGKLKEID